jgi:hypothetical protein
MVTEATARGFRLEPAHARHTFGASLDGIRGGRWVPENRQRGALAVSNRREP